MRVIMGLYDVALMGTNRNGNNHIFMPVFIVDAYATKYREVSRSDYNQ